MQKEGVYLDESPVKISFAVIRFYHTMPFRRFHYPVMLITLPWALHMTSSSENIARPIRGVHHYPSSTGRCPNRTSVFSR